MTFVLPGDILQVKNYFIDEAFVARARPFDLKIHHWTVNDQSQMEQLFDAGVDGLITQNCCPRCCRCD